MADDGASDQQPEPSDDARSLAIAKASKLNDRAFTLAVFALFLPFIGVVVSAVAIVLGVRSRRDGRELGVELSKSPVTFGILVTCVWGFLDLGILAIALFA